MSKPELRLAADFGASPLWTSEGNIGIEDLALSPRLSTELNWCAEEFDATTPKGRRMKRGDYVATDWTARGLRLARAPG